VRTPESADSGSLRNLKPSIAEATPGTSRKQATTRRKRPKKRERFHSTGRRRGGRRGEGRGFQSSSWDAVGERSRGGWDSRNYCMREKQLEGLYQQFLTAELSCGSDRNSPGGKGWDWSDGKSIRSARHESAAGQDHRVACAAGPRAPASRGGRGIAEQGYAGPSSPGQARLRF